MCTNFVVHVFVVLRKQMSADSSQTDYSQSLLDNARARRGEGESSSVQDGFEYFGLALQGTQDVDLNQAKRKDF